MRVSSEYQKSSKISGFLATVTLYGNNWQFEDFIKDFKSKIPKILVLCTLSHSIFVLFVKAAKIQEEIRIDHND